MFSSSSPLNELDALSSSARAKLQIQSYEALLSLRIALQRSLDLANKLPVIPSDEVIEALNEQSTKDSEKKDLSEEYSHLHDSLYQLQSGLYESLSSQREDGKGDKKRRRDELSDSPDAQWKEISELQGSLEEKWKTTLNKWHGRMHFGSEKVKNSLTVFNVAAWDQIEDHVSHENKTLEKSRIPLEESERIGARTVSLSIEKRRKTDVDVEVYDDRAFYSLLLKAFISSHSSESGGSGDVASMRASDLEALRKYRSKKNASKVDRKASKGRKIRYVVHNKIQNFMFPMPLTSQLEYNIDSERLFQSLFQ